MSLFVHRLNMGGAGPRVAIKDVIDVAGLPTGGASRALEYVAPALRHADAVESLLAADCRLVGKVTLHELAFGATGINAWAGTLANPIDPRRIPGGSSSGSAVAVACGEADIALGTDTGGSIRVPAACCGIFGLKPSFGRVSRRGVLPAVSSLDCVGPLARDMKNIVFAMKALDPNFEELKGDGARIGRLDVGAKSEILAAMDAALDASGLSVKRMSLAGMDTAFNAAVTIINRESFDAFGYLLASGLVGEDVAVRLTAAGRTTKEQLALAEVERIRFREQVDALLALVDILALPTLPDFPPFLDDAGQDRSGVALTALVRPFNLSGHPALNIPIPTAFGFPAGLQLVGRRGEDALLCAVGKRLHTAAITLLSGEATHV